MISRVFLYKKEETNSFKKQTLRIKKEINRGMNIQIVASGSQP